MRKKILAAFLSLCLGLGMFSQKAFAEIPETNDFISELYGDMALGSLLMENYSSPVMEGKGLLESYEYYSPLSHSSTGNSDMQYHASAGVKKDFVAGDLFYIAYEAGDSLKIAAFDKAMKFVHGFVLPRELELFGAAAGDNEGNFYIAWGKEIGGETEADKAMSNIKLVKYDGETGEKLGTAEYIGGEGYFHGTKLPFSASNASIAVGDSVVALHFGRSMFASDDGANHQSSTSLYADRDSMQPLEFPTVYSSHSFDQQVIATKDGGFLFVDQGDAYPRAFRLSYLSDPSDGPDSKLQSMDSFHFKPVTGGGNAYNYTLANLGGIVETSSAYVLSGSSEKTLEGSSPKGGAEPRNVFIQVLKKDFLEYPNDRDRYLLYGETRSRAEAKDYAAAATDYGVIWLTDLAEGQSALYPKICALDGDRIAVFWELYQGTATETGYTNNKYIGSYYTVLNSRFGQLLKEATELKGVRLSANDRPVYYNGKVCWSVTVEGSPSNSSTALSAGTVKIHTLDVDASPEQAWKNPFTDIKSSLWHYDYVKFAFENNLMNGISHSQFSPNSTLSRAMVATVLHRMSGSPDASYSPVFTDVADDLWYSKSIMWAYESGVVTGYGNELFGPNDVITREQLAAMMYRYEELNGGDMASRSELSSFTDSASVSSWAKTAMEWSVSTGLISGVTASTLVPSGTATRAQCATILTRYMSRILS